MFRDVPGFTDTPKGGEELKLFTVFRENGLGISIL